MPTSKPKPVSSVQEKNDALFAAMAAYEIAIVSILETLAKTQPATARTVLKSLATHRELGKSKRYPKVQEKLEQYEKLMKAILDQHSQ